MRVCCMNTFCLILYTTGMMPPAGPSGQDPAEQHLLTMSTLNEEGVMGVKTTACDRLLAHRVEIKVGGGCRESFLCM